MLVIAAIVVFASYFTSISACLSLYGYDDLPADSFWKSGAKMPTPRSETASVILGDKIYVIGGLDKMDKPLDIVEVYDVKLDKWSIAAPLPIPLDHSGADVFNEKIYLVGGKGIDSQTSNRVFIYDPAVNKWEEGKPMPTGRYALTVDFVDGVLFAIGGKNKELMGYAHETLSVNEVYNPKTDKWTTKAPMLTPRHHAASAVWDGELYVIGGRNTNFPQRLYLDDNEMYDSKTNSWQKLQPMPTKRSASDTAVVDGTIHVFGGEVCDEGGKSNKVFSDHEVYNTKLNKWTKELSMPTARHGPSIQFANNSIFVIGGGVQPCTSQSQLNEILVLRPHLNSINDK
jgi:N-acetylneuraminic acid mutarotase